MKRRKLTKYINKHVLKIDALNFFKGASFNDIIARCIAQALSYEFDTTRPVIYPSKLGDLVVGVSSDNINFIHHIVPPNDDIEGNATMFVDYGFICGKDKEMRSLRWLMEIAIDVLRDRKTESQSATDTEVIHNHINSYIKEFESYIKELKELRGTNN